ncbi:hypothetical protein LS72_001005 [Helicobacter apodemus]|uniref:DUF5666 domain-containing protein n=1 Tax=Helicobacter apodemus TaxID=135569 RepID=A0A4U8UG50_9HELI|nr:hypothetical protein [Helicobacter apodemus]MDE6958300.1 hypothetical protein [Helicobacter apodemus]TLE16996.1 hypothetical protein LS72_001005 [Helicobacter apodemus]
MKLKKILGALSLVTLFSGAMMADNDFDVYGQISAVDSINKTITLASPGGGQLVIQVLPYTKIKGDDCGAFGNDIYGTFKDLTMGKFIKAEVVHYGAYPPAQNPGTQSPNTTNNTHYTAKEIEWECRRKAY